MREVILTLFFTPIIIFLTWFFYEAYIATVLTDEEWSRREKKND